MFRSKNTKPLTPTSADDSEGASNDTAAFLKSMNDPECIERVRVVIKNAHVFKLPTRQTVSCGWRGADWKQKVWQGTVKVVDRLNITAILLVDSINGCIFAVCPLKDGSVDRCVDSSRYFVLRIEDSSGRHMFIGVAFNERNDAFDFNTSLEDARREREAELAPPVLTYNGPKLVSLKEGEKIHVSIPKGGNSDRQKNIAYDVDGGTEAFQNFFDKLDDDEIQESPPSPIQSVPIERKKPVKSAASSTNTGFLRPSSKDTPSRR